MLPLTISKNSNIKLKNSIELNIDSEESDLSESFYKDILEQSLNDEINTKPKHEEIIKKRIFFIYHLKI